MENFISEYPNNDYESCDSFFYNISYYGFDSITMKFNEEIKSTYYQANKIYNYENNEEIIKNKFKNIVLSQEYKMNIIIYRFVIIEVIKQSLDKLFDNFEIIFNDAMKFSLIINIILIILYFWIFYFLVAFYL